MAKDSFKTVSFRLNLEKQDEREIYEYLESIDRGNQKQEFADKSKFLKMLVKEWIAGEVAREATETKRHEEEIFQKTLLKKLSQEVEKAIYSQLNRKVSEANIQEAMMTGTSSLGEEYTKVMQEQIRNFAEELEAQLKENGFDPELTPIIYAGGGAVVMKLFGNIRGSHICYLEDVKANAIGYEYFAVKKLQKQVIS